MLQDLTFAIRTWLARPAFAAAAVATLAVGIGATTAIFSTINAALLRPLPYPDPDNLFTLGTTLVDGRFATGLIAPSEAIALNESAPSVVKAAIVRPADNTIVPGQGGAGATAGPEPVQVVIYSVSEGFFDLFGLRMAVGRGFNADEHAAIVPAARPPGTPFVPPAQVAVLSHRVWRNQFASDPDIVGTPLQFANGRATIVGVAAPGFDIPAGADVWTNMRPARQSVAHSYSGYLRVKPGTSPERMNNELTAAMAGVAKMYPASASGRVYVTEPLVSGIVGDLGPILIVVLSGAGLLLLLACVNVTNLLLARSAVRSREIALRTALGAGRARIVRQLLTESLALATVGTILGLVIAFVGVRVLLAKGA
jgi:predicted permease